MMNRKLRRLGGLFTMLVLLVCLLTVSAFAGEYDDRYGYSKLNDKQKLAYSALETAVAEKRETAELLFDWQIDADTDIDLLYELLRVFVADYPEYYWFTGDVSSFGSSTYDGETYHITKINLIYDTEGKSESAFNAAANELLSGCPDGSNYEKALFIHDKLANHIEYDLGWVDDQSAYSAIVEGKAVCAGYARAYQYLLNCVGIDAWTVEGFGLHFDEGEISIESHAWNLVWIDGNCVYTDVTWDDQTHSVGYIYRAYFNRSLDKISKDHVTDSEYVEGWTDYFKDKLPECSHDSESYFDKNSINEVAQISVDSLAANVQKVDDYQYIIHVLYDDFDQDTLTDWLKANSSALVNATEINSLWVSGVAFTGLGDELRIFIYTPYAGLEYFDGRIDSIERGTLTAYVCYLDSDLENIKSRPEQRDEPDYETVMVAYYDDNDALISVAFTDLTLDGACRAELTADCPDEFAYCRVFVVGSDANPNPLCDLLEMSSPAAR